MRKFIPFLLVFLLWGCAETELASHVWKTYDPPAKSQGTFKVGNPYVIQGQQYVPVERYDHSETGIASWYGPGFHGKRTANGEMFHQGELTAAHKTLQMPSLIRVTNLENGRSLILRVNDRGPYSRGRVLDVSERGAELLGFKGRGTAKVRIDVLPEESRHVAEMAKQGMDTRGYEVAMNQNRIPTAGRPPEQVVVQQQTTTYQTASVQPVTRQQVGSVPVHASATQPGVVYPEPIVQQVPVRPSNIYVQAGSFGSEPNAIALSQKLAPVGQVRITPAQVNGKTFYRVRLGPYAEVAQADSALNTAIGSGAEAAVIIVD